MEEEEELTHEEDSIVDRALLETYAKKDITPETNLKEIKEIPVMSDLQEILESMTGGEGLAARLDKFTHGTFAGLLNNPTNVDVDNQLIAEIERNINLEETIKSYKIENYDEIIGNAYDRWGKDKRESKLVHYGDCP